MTWPGVGAANRGIWPGVFVWCTLLLAPLSSYVLLVAARSHWATAEALSAAQAAGSTLLNALLPTVIVERLAAGAESVTTVNDDVAILVADIAGFTSLSAAAESPDKVFQLLNSAMREFERVAHAEGAFKVKTVGDCIIVAAGLRDFPAPAATRAERVALLIRVARGVHVAATHLGLSMHVGIHVGAVVSGVLSTRGFVLDVWGEGVDGAVAAADASSCGRTILTAAAAAASQEAPPLERVTLERVPGDVELWLKAMPTASDRRPSGERLASASGVDPTLLTWTWNALSCDRAGLEAAARALLLPSAVASGAREAAVTDYVAAVLATHSESPFHNVAHVVMVLQAAMLLAWSLRAQLQWTDRDVLLLGVAALGHDAGHRGFTNVFELATGSPIALAHGNSGPVLERFHAATASSALLASGLLDALDAEERAIALQTATGAIMSTDMARHDAIVSDLTRARALADLSKDTLAAALIHTADLAAHAFPRTVSLAWSERIADEFGAQVAAEAAVGLPSAPFMLGLDAPAARAKMQAGFVGFVVAPLWRGVAALAGGALDEPLRNVEENAAMYTAEAERLLSVKGAK